MGEYQMFDGLATDPLSRFEYVSNLSLFPNPHSTIHIQMKETRLRQRSQLDATPGNFVKIKPVRQPQVLSNLNKI